MLTNTYDTTLEGVFLSVEFTYETADWGKSFDVEILKITTRNDTTNIVPLMNPALIEELETRICSVLAERV